MDPAYNPAVWSTFFSAEAGASAALAGLIFVAVSINLPKIIVARALTARSAKALFALAIVLIASTLCMAPGQIRTVLGGELVISGLIAWVAGTIVEWVATHKNPYIGRPQRVFHFVLAQCAAAPFAAGGVSLILGSGGGLYWLLAGTVFAFIAALLDAWVLLIEILR